MLNPSSAKSYASKLFEIFIIAGIAKHKLEIILIISYFLDSLSSSSILFIIFSIISEFKQNYLKFPLWISIISSVDIVANSSNLPVFDLFNYL